MNWLAALGPILGGLGAILGALNGRQARRHRRRLEALEARWRVVRALDEPLPPYPGGPDHA